MNGYGLNKDYEPGSFSVLKKDSLLERFLVPPIYWTKSIINDWNEHDLM